MKNYQKGNAHTHKKAGVSLVTMEGHYQNGDQNNIACAFRKGSSYKN